MLRNAARNLADFLVSFRVRDRIHKEIDSLNPGFFEVDIFGVRAVPGVCPSPDKADLSTDALRNRQRTGICVRCFDANNRTLAQDLL